MTFLRVGARLWWGLVPLLLLLWGVGALAAVSIPGIPESPLATLLAVPGLSFIRTIAIALAIGALILRVIDPAPVARMWAAAWGLVAIALSLTGIAALRSDIAATGLLAVGEGMGLVDVVAQVASARALAFQALCMGLAVILVVLGGTRGWRIAALVIALVGSAAPAIAGHAGLSGSHSVASLSIALHVMSVCCWVGGLAAAVALIAVDESTKETLLRRFSVVALVCALVAGETGLLTATLVTGSLSDLVGTEYGSIVLVKCLVFAWLIRLGWMQRRRVVDRLHELPAVTSLASITAIELVVMGSAIAAATVLARIGPSPIPGTGFAPLAVVTLGVGIPLLLGALIPVRWRWTQRAPEVMAVVMLIVIVEVAGVGLLRTLLGPLGLMVEIALLVGVGWIAASGMRASRGALVLLACGLPVALGIAGFLADRLGGMNMWLIAMIAAEAAVMPFIRGRRTPSQSQAAEVVTS